MSREKARRRKEGDSRDLVSYVVFDLQKGDKIMRIVSDQRVIFGNRVS